MSFKKEKEVMRNVLIPTDFSIESLQLVERAVAALDDQSMNIILFHAFDIPSHAPDMLGSSRRVPYAHLLTDEFRNACRRIKTSNARTVQNIHIRHFYGNTVAVFRNYIDAHDIDMIICPEPFVFRAVSDQSVNPESLFRKSGIPVLTTLAKRRTVIQSAAPLAEAVAVLIN
ncbi:MAG: hypothetical protein ABS85_06475 [Sphingobacteriales bacterium SCN 48-20]|nr:MAG: hypothetical protein ABS85_06475 [Sphingobacteriales bacterium SCN 48-20]OJW44867.1 MAG: hypothetical protein BGO56_15545 [Sphingobacteriales bacterium 48-107]